MNFRRNLIRTFTFLGGIYFFLEFALPAEFLGIKFDKYNDQITDGFIAVGALAIGLGLINILSVHLSSIVFKRAGMYNSLALLFGLGLMFSLAALDWNQNETISGDAERFFTLRDFSSRITADFEADHSGPNLFRRNIILRDETKKLVEECSSQIGSGKQIAEQGGFENAAQLGAALDRFASSAAKAPALLQSLATSSAADSGAPDLRGNSELAALLGELGGLRRDWLSYLYSVSQLKLVYSFVYDGLFVALGSAMFSLLGFYIASAAYRAFRVRSIESGLMLAAAFLVMLGQIPFGLWISEQLPSWRLWILEVPNSAAFRAIKIGAAVAGLVMAFRMWLSIESESFGEKKQG